MVKWSYNVCMYVCMCVYHGRENVEFWFGNSKLPVDSHLYIWKEVCVYVQTCVCMYVYVCMFRLTCAREPRASSVPKYNRIFFKDSKAIVAPVRVGSPIL